MKKIGAVVILILLLVTACSNTDTQNNQLSGTGQQDDITLTSVVTQRAAVTTNTPTPMVKPTNTPTPAVAPTNTPIPTAAPTNTPTSTVTPTNTPTPTVTPTNTPTPTVTPTNTPTPTPEELTIENMSAFKWVNEITAGWNLGNSLDSWYGESGYDINPKSETRWGNPVVTKELIDFVVDQGFNLIRIPVTWSHNSGRDENGRLIIGEKFLARVHEVVDYAIENDVYVMLDSHHDDEIIYCGVKETEEWQQVQRDVKDLWTQIAESFKDYNEKLIFEAFNEVDNIAMGFTFSELSAGQMNILNQLFVDTVRGTGGNNRNRVLVLPTLFDSVKTDVLNAFILPEDEVKGKLAVTVHAYKQEFDQDVDWVFQTVEDFTKRVNVPVVISEFGASYSYHITEWKEEFTSNYIARAASHGIKCCIWDDNKKFKFINRTDFNNSNFSVIEAVFLGLQGYAYETKNKIILNDIEQFSFTHIDIKTGELIPVDYVNKWWGSIVSNTIDSNQLPVKGKDKLVVTMITKNRAVDFWLIGVAFYDIEGNMILYKGGRSVSQRFLSLDIPDGAVTAAVYSYDPYVNQKIDQIKQYLADGDLQVSITIIDDINTAQLQEIQLQLNK